VERVRSIPNNRDRIASNSGHSKAAIRPLNELLSDTNTADVIPNNEDDVRKSLNVRFEVGKCTVFLKNDLPSGKILSPFDQLVMIPRARYRNFAEMEN
jgi:hypothetical protein